MTSKGNFVAILLTIITEMYTGHGRTLSAICTDNAKEYGANMGNTEIQLFMKARGINLELSAPYAHEQSGAQERLHRTLDSGTRAALMESGAPDPFWALARGWFCEILNHVPNPRATQAWASLGNKGPCSAYGYLNKSGTVNTFHLKPFGCRCYVLAPGDQKMNALQRRGIPAIFVGYPSGSKGFLAYVPGREHLIISANVTFHENEFPFKEGAVCWDHATSQGEWAKDYTDPGRVLDAVSQEKVRHGAEKYKQNLKSFDYELEDIVDFDAQHPDNLSGQNLDLKAEPDSVGYSLDPEKLIHREGTKTKPAKKEKKTPMWQVDKWIAANLRVAFTQKNPKSGDSARRYELYKHCKTMAEFVKAKHRKADLQNDIDAGHCKILSRAQAASDSENENEGSDPDMSEGENQSDSEKSEEAETTTRAGRRRSSRIARAGAAAAPVFNLPTAFMGIVSGSLLTALSSAVCDGNTHPAMLMASSAVFVMGHLVLTSQENYNYLHSRIKHTGAKIPTGYTMGCYHDSKCEHHIDLLEPFYRPKAHSLNLYGHVKASGGLYSERETMLDAACPSLDAIGADLYFGNSTSSLRDDVGVLYVDGSERMLDSMQDILTGIKTPWTLKDALLSPQREKWIKALQEEMEMLVQHGTYELVDRASLPPGTPVISSKIAWRVKLDDDNNPIRYKARCTARGFSQIYGVNYRETFQPVARLEAIRAFIAYSTMRGYPMLQMDFEGAYLQGDADYEMYMDFPKGLDARDAQGKSIWGFEVPPGKVAKLKKSLYGLKQAGARWILFMFPLLTMMVRRI